MPLETASYVSDLNVANPAHTDQLNQADAHIRLVKTSLKNTFPNFTATGLQSTQAEIDAVAHTGTMRGRDGTAADPAIGYKGDLTAGFYRNAPGHQAIVGRLNGNGAVPVGALQHFPMTPPNNGVEWLICNGAVYNMTAFPELGAYLGGTFGGDGVNTFAVPNLTDTGRFLRSYSGAFGPGTYQANTLKTHNHTGTTGAGGAHSHGVTDPGHHHALSSFFAQTTQAGNTGAFTCVTPSGGFAALSAGTDNATTGISINAAADHTHAFTTTANSDGGGSETRPEAFAVYIAIKT